MLTYEPEEDVEPAPEDDDVDELTRAFLSALERDRT